jgi:hypothetical protein
MKTAAQEFIWPSCGGCGLRLAELKALRRERRALIDICIAPCAMDGRLVLGRHLGTPVHPSHDSDNGGRIAPGRNRTYDP